MNPTLRSDLLPAICSYLPAEDARWILSRDPSDYLTHIEAYACIRRHELELPRLLLRDFANGLVAYLEGPLEDATAS